VVEVRAAAILSLNLSQPNQTNKEQKSLSTRILISSETPKDRWMDGWRTIGEVVEWNGMNNE
jgi:hypothetical protein